MGLKAGACLSLFPAETGSFNQWLPALAISLLPWGQSSCASCVTCWSWCLQRKQFPLPAASLAQAGHTQDPGVSFTSDTPSSLMASFFWHPRGKGDPKIQILPRRVFGGLHPSLPAVAKRYLCSPKSLTQTLGCCISLFNLQFKFPDRQKQPSCSLKIARSYIEIQEIASASSSS